MKRVISYFFQGLLLIAPIGITITIAVEIIIGVGSISDQIGLKIHPMLDPVLGFTIVLFVLVVIGFLSSTFLFKPIFSLLEKLINRTPIVKIIYSSMKDLFSAFVSDKKKFNRPVLVDFNKDGLQKLGFMTEEDLSKLGIENKVAVYFPHSYAFSGNLFIVNKENITILNKTSSTDAMKFIVSGGVTDLD